MKTSLRQGRRLFPTGQLLVICALLMGCFATPSFAQQSFSGTVSISNGSLNLIGGGVVPFSVGTSSYGATLSASAMTLASTSARPNAGRSI